MRKGIGPNNLGAPKGVGKMMDSPAKQAKKVNTDEMGREGHFNPTTARTKRAFNNYANRESEFSEPYQNQLVRPKRIEDKNVYGPAGYKAVKKIGVVENKMKRQHKYNSVMGLRADAYTAKANNFGVKKPKVNIK